MARVLVVGPAWIGDMVMAQSLFISLKQQNHTIDVLAPEWSLPILARMPEVNDSYALNIPHGKLNLRLRYKLAKKLSTNNYAKAIIIPRSFKAALVPFFAKIPNRISFKGEMRYGLLTDIRLLDKRILSQTVQKIVALGLSAKAKLPPIIIFPKLTIDKVNQQQLLHKFKLGNAKNIGLMPSAEYGKAKQWPVEHFITVANKANKLGWQVLVFGSEKDKYIGQQITDNSAAINLCGLTSLIDAVDLLASCHQVITNDSGLMHIAAAVDCEIIAIYGSSDPKYTPPLTNKKHIHYLALDCSPCFARICKFNTYACLTAITPENIL